MSFEHLQGRPATSRLAAVAQATLDTPWKLPAELRRYLTIPMARALLAMHGVGWGRGWRLYGIPIIRRHRQSTITVGAALKLRSHLTSNPLGPNHPVMWTTWEAGALLEIGDDFAMTGGVICAAKQIRIGNHVMIGANCTIVDTDFHPIDADLRRASPMQVEPRAITIEDDVFVGMNSIVLKGVTIGQGSVVGAGSVVTRSFPPKSLIAGNPATLIRTL